MAGKKILVLIYSCAAHCHLEESLLRSSWCEQVRRLANTRLMIVRAAPSLECSHIVGDYLWVKAEESYAKLSIKTHAMFYALDRLGIDFDYVVKLDVSLVHYSPDHQIDKIATKLTFERFEMSFWEESLFAEYGGIALMTDHTEGRILHWAKVKGLRVCPEKAFGSESIPPFYQGKCYTLDRKVARYIAKKGAVMSQIHCQYLGGAEDLMVGRLYQEMLKEKGNDHEL